MDNPWNAISDALNEARRLDTARRSFSCAMGRLLVGFLRHCDDETCSALKRELQKFDSRSGHWRRA